MLSTAPRLAWQKGSVTYEILRSRHGKVITVFSRDQLRIDALTNIAREHNSRRVTWILTFLEALPIQEKGAADLIMLMVNNTW